MDIKERAKDYAEGKATAAIEQAIANAYADGYKDGYQDREDEIPMEIKESTPEFFDMEFPSGTLWATDFLRDENGKVLYVSFREAQKFNLPTKEQVEELMKRKSGSDPLCLITPAAKTILIPWNGYYEGYYFRPGLYFWLASEEDENHQAKAFIETNGSLYYSKDKYVGLKLPVLIVKSKD